MKLNWLILTVFIVGCVLLFQSGCKQQPRVTSVPKPPLKTEPAAPAKPQTVPDSNVASPRIVLEKTVHDFGEIGPETGNSCQFKFANAGEGVLKIEKVQSTCGCAVPELAKREYASGESGTIDVQFRSPEHPGTTTKHLYIHNNDSNNPKVELVITAKIVIKVKAEPENLHLSLRAENAGCPDITLTSLDGQPFAITRFKSTADCVTADHDPTVAATKFVLQPKVDIGKLRERLNGTISIELTHPECKAVSIPFSTLAVFQINPPTIVVLKAESQKPMTRELWVLNNYNENFEIESVSSKSGMIKVLSQEKNANSYKLVLEITPPALEGTKRFFTDTLLLNVKGGEQLQVGCRGYYQKRVEKVEPSPSQ